MAGSEHTGDPGARRTFAFADVEIDARAHQLRRGGREIPLEPKAFAVLLEFLAHPGQLRSRDQLLDAVWGHSFVTPATLNRIIAQLRRALADDSENPHCIQTVHGLGYRFIAVPREVLTEPAPVMQFGPSSRGRLPPRAEALIGRERDVEQLGQLLRDNRLVTVIGPGGVGKTQAALETAWRLAAEFPDGVWFFDCTLLSDEAGLASLLASTFDVRTASDTGDLITHLSELLRGRRALIVFDNSERIAAQLGEVMAKVLVGCPALHALVTSQCRLNCTGEWLYPLPPLAMPPEGDWTSEAEISGLSQIAAVQLLLTRLHGFASGFSLSAANAASVADLCRRLEGIPLALELAAARLRVLGLEQLLVRMDERMLNLAEAKPSRPAHHQNLRALIEWSFALLAEHEQSLLCGLSIFAGGCTFGGAAAIGATLGLDDPQTLNLLGRLIDKSLLRVDIASNPPGYHLLDSVRLFAQERLAAGSGEAHAREAHLLHFVQFSERANAELLGERQSLWFERIRREWTNLRIAFEYAVSRPEHTGRALELAGNLCWYFRAPANYVEPVALLERALREAPGSSRARAQATVAYGMMLHHSRESGRAISRLREGAALADAQGDRWLAGAGRAILAFELALSSDFPAAEEAVVSALAVAEALDDGWLRSNALLSRGIGHSLNGRHGAAVTCMSEALECVASHGDYFQRAYSRINLALERFYVGDLSGAAHDWVLVLDEFVRAKHARGAAGVVEGTAYLAYERGEFEKAARFLAAAARVRRITGAPLFQQWRNAQQAAENKARAALGREFRRAQEAGAVTRFEDIVGEARAILAEIAVQPLRAGANNPSGS